MNTFTQPYIAGMQEEVICPLYDPREVRDNRKRFRRNTVPMLELANSIYVPTGRRSARGWILLARGDYNKLNTYGNSFQLEVGNSDDDDNTDILTNLSIVQAQCVTRGIASDTNAIYLVELTDDRGILHNRWFHAPINSFYNILAPAYPQLYISDSLDSGSPWTWATMLEDMWGQLNTIGGGGILGDWPGLPFNPTGTPQGWWFVGVPGWYAINNVLEYVGMTVVCDLTEANPYTIVTAGAADAEFSDLQNSYQTNIEDDQEWIDTGSGRIPLIVTVLFRRRNQYYGTEETVRRDTPQFENIPYYSITINAPAPFSNAVGEHFIWSDFTVRYDTTNTPLAADVTTATAIANERVTQYYNRIYRTNGYMSKTYTGALPFTTGSQVDAVRWYQDYKDVERQGWKTDIIRGFRPDWLDSYGEWVD